MQYRMLGDVKSSMMGFGCMGLSEFYGDIPSDEASIELIQTAFEKGINFFDTADVYGYGHNEILLGKAIAPFREKVIVATKCGIVRKKDDPNARGLNGSPNYIKKCCDESLKRLGIECIDLFYLHRLDPDTPIEVTMSAMVDLVKAGKIKGVGFSEIDAYTIRRAHSVHPLTAIQTEYSIWRRGVESDGVLDACKALGITLVAYSPLGRGFLTGKIENPNQLAAGDFRKGLPRFQGDNFNANLVIVDKLKPIAEKKRISLSQLALAWVINKAENIIPIPGTKKIGYLLENIAASEVMLTPEEMTAIDDIAPIGVAKGERYTPAAMAIYGLKDDVASE